MPVTDHVVLMLTGRDLSAEDTRVLSAVSAQIGTLLEREQLRGEASTARVERARSDIRSSLLAAVSHDLRSPLAGIKACVGTLRAPDLDLPEADRAELLAGIETSADRLQGLIDNLLDMSRLDAGALVLRTEPVALDEVVPRALAGVPPERVDVDVRVTLPMVVGDAGLIERIIANLVENALRYSPPDQPVRITAGTIKDKVVLRVVDKGPGVPSAQPRIHLQRLPTPRRRPRRPRRRTRPGRLPRIRPGQRRDAGRRGDPRRRPHHGADPPTRRSLGP